MASAKKMLLGELLVRAGVIDEMQLQSALAHQKQWGGRLGRHIVELRFTDPRTISRALAKQLGLPSMDPARQSVDLTLLKKFPEKYAVDNCCLPLQRNEKTISVVIADPTNLVVCDDIETRLGKRIEFSVAAEQTIAELIERAYRGVEYGDEVLEPQADESITKAQHQQSVESGTRYAQDLSQEPGPERGETPEVPLTERLGHAESEPSEAPLAKLTPAESPSLVQPPPEPPAKPTRAVQAKPVPSPATDLRALLLVDSDRSERDLLRRSLRRAGYAVSELPGVAEALAQIQKAPPHAVLVEITPENLKALELCKKLRASERYKSLPVVLLSQDFAGWRARADLEDLAKGAQVVEKPVAPEELLVALERAGAEPNAPARTGKDAAHAEAVRLETEGRVHYEQGKFDQAISCFEQAVEFDDTLADAYYHLGLAFEQKKRLGSAAKAYEQAAERDPGSFLAFKNLALVYEKLGFHRKAYEAFERSARTCPNPQVKAKIKAHLSKLL